MEEQEEKLARAISALPRRQMLRMLSKHELTVKEIAAKTNISVSLASRHLTFLYDLGLLNVRKLSINKYYSLKHKGIMHLLKIFDAVAYKL